MKLTIYYKTSKAEVKHSNQQNDQLFNSIGIIINPSCN